MNNIVATSTGFTVIMGRKTLESLKKPLPNRRNIVLTTQEDYTFPGVEVVHSLDAALELCKEEDEVFIIGGGKIYALALELGQADRIHRTIIHGEFEGDTFFHLPEGENWVVIEREHHEADEKNPYAYTFEILEQR